MVVPITLKISGQPSTRASVAVRAPGRATIAQALRYSSTIASGPKKPWACRGSWGWAAAQACSCWRTAARLPHKATTSSWSPRGSTCSSSAKWLLAPLPPVPSTSRGRPANTRGAGGAS